MHSHWTLPVSNPSPRMHTWDASAYVSIYICLCLLYISLLILWYRWLLWSPVLVCMGVVLTHGVAEGYNMHNCCTWVYGEFVCTHAHACINWLNCIECVRGMWYTAGDMGKGMDLRKRIFPNCVRACLQANKRVCMYNTPCMTWIVRPK